MYLSENYDYIYLHGFASSIQSSKAKYFQDQFNKCGVNLLVPDLNQNNFIGLTLSRQIVQIQTIINESLKPVVLIGSSMGGLISVILAENNPNIEKIILLAPAFKMSKLWQDGMTLEQLNEWQINGYAEVFHYGYEKSMPLNYNFYLDLFKHNDYQFNRQLPALIFHGSHDEVVPIEFSHEYSKLNNHASLVSFADNHSLETSLDHIWVHSYDFINKY